MYEDHFSHLQIENLSYLRTPLSWQTSRPDFSLATPLDLAQEPSFGQLPVPQHRIG